MRILVHHLNLSRSARILWLLEELGLDYEIQKYERVSGRAPESLRTIHPLGKAPLVDIDGEVYAESGAIVEKLCSLRGDGGGGLVPREASELKQYFFYLHYAEGSLGAPLLLKFVMQTVKKGAPWLARPLVSPIVKAVDSNFTDPEITHHMDFLEASLSKGGGGGGWMCGGSFTAADIMMFYPVDFALQHKMFQKPYPHLCAWVEKCKARDSWKRALEKGGE